MRCPLVILTLFTVACSTASPEDQVAGKAYRAMRELQGAIRTGVPLVEYGPLIRRASAEILMLRDVAAPGSADARIADHYDRALAIYQDAGNVWLQKIEDSQYEFIPKGRIIVHEKVAGIPERYGFKVEEVTMYGQKATAIEESSIQVLWDLARKEAARGDSLLLARR